MSDYDKNFLKDKYKELEKDLSKPEVRQPNDHILLIDGLNMGGNVWFVGNKRFQILIKTGIVKLILLMCSLVTVRVCCSFSDSCECVVEDG